MSKTNQKKGSKKPAFPDESPPSAESGHNAEKEKPAETGGPKGPEPTRYGDWERKGIVSDF